MNRRRLEVADVFREYGERFLRRQGRQVSLRQRQALRNIGCCQTAALGGHLQQCDSCEQRSIGFNSCRDRHCPKCQSAARDRWLEARAEELLPVPHAHVIFTVASELRPVALQNPETFYELFFRAAADSLIETAAQQRLLGARIGLLAILHTWAQNLLFHPHLHCLVPAGGLSTDGSRWISPRKSFFLPAKLLSRKFRAKMLAALSGDFERGELKLYGQLEKLRDPETFAAWLDQLKLLDWVVHVKKPLRNSDHVLHYLARYTYRSAISNGRLLSLADDRLRFRWRNSRQGNRQQAMGVEAVEFIRRFLLHVLPPGFVKIRYYGLWANRDRSKRLAHCRRLLAACGQVDQPRQILTAPQRRAVKRRCPLCRQGRLRILYWLSPAELFLRQFGLPPPLDSSPSR